MLLFRHQFVLELWWRTFWKREKKNRISFRVNSNEANWFGKKLYFRVSSVGPLRLHSWHRTFSSFTSDIFQTEYWAMTRLWTRLFIQWAQLGKHAPLWNVCLAKLGLFGLGWSAKCRALTTAISHIIVDHYLFQPAERCAWKELWQFDVPCAHMTPKIWSHLVLNTPLPFFHDPRDGK